MGQNFIPDTVNQTLLFPPSLHDWLPEGHLARFLLDVVSALDLSAIYKSYQDKDGRGQAAYAPEMMVCLLHGASPKEAMREKLRTAAGRAVYKMRKAIVEPVFGQIKEQRGFRRFSLRGKENVSREWKLVCAVSNLLKLFRADWGLEMA